jgi:hypothetical protein
MKMNLNEIIDLLVYKGDSQYGGESISQLQHALQCANLAQEANESPQLITASFLHDIGHLITEEFSDKDLSSPHKDDLHQFIAIPFLRPHFSEEVLGAIKFHVDAKKFLCFSEPSYWESLSPTSKHTLELQGGVFNSQEAQFFIAQPFAKEAVRLRRYDDLAKVPNAVTPTLSHFREIARTVANH